MNPALPQLTVQNLWKVYPYGDYRVEALKGVSFEVAKGEMISIMGPSGCGKTTLLNCVSGLDTIDQGSIRIDGVEQTELKSRSRDAYRAGHMGFVFQAYNLIPVLTAAENVELPLLSLGMKPKLAREKALEALSRVGLHDRSGHLPSELSGGQQQRVAIARAIVNQPLIVWADEPTGALDSRTTTMVMDLIEHLNRTEKITFIIVTHNPDVAQYSHRTLFMDSGHVIQNRANRGRSV
ncbi:ABC transporter ATP-binding protein [Paenibacillus sp. LHD-117]|uniref:ABC transporter ATP-binding protein n=1 Tax=Paenibacillus sp. LHD-117 TaxID=3071412 RepID=UPI0027DF6C2B|nr:ABC transporter ATP-binding protein [Paenibacillus sp. LHD-117]MDQ6423648.1 ABC transporter ATP-binding protein [Paenibacillus sp. LHD-117]